MKLFWNRAGRIVCAAHKPHGDTGKGFTKIGAVAVEQNNLRCEMRAEGGCK